MTENKYFFRFHALLLIGLGAFFLGWMATQIMENIRFGEPYSDYLLFFFMILLAMVFVGLKGKVKLTKTKMAKE